ncbi:hypothetical protein ACFYZJ_21650 [Streptomyces sp. NPDC001848]|uniref:hypothetical protein n=1 Tax=Streptomyces sp. NPDC001848 TaxID=3364618 RepID=UPI0036AA250F
MTLQEQRDGSEVHFTSIAEVMERVDPTRISIIPLLEGDAGTTYLVVWPPNTDTPCEHGGKEERAFIIDGEIIDEDGKRHGPGDVWLRGPHAQHHPRSGPAGARLLLRQDPV